MQCTAKSSRAVLRLVFSFLAFFIVLIISHAQEGESFGGFDTGLIGAEPSRAETSMRIASWNPETREGYIAVQFLFPGGYYQLESPEYFTLEPLASAGIVYGSVLKPEPAYEGETAKYDEQAALLLEFNTAADTGLLTMEIIAHFQLCDESGVCLLPDFEHHEIRFDPAGRVIEADETVREILRWNSRPLRGEPSSWTGILLYLLMALVGGLLLNIMPCVLPLLSVKAIGLVRQAASERRAILGHAWLYVAGIEVSFWILAAIVIVFQASGRLLGWGFQFQNPTFVLILISVIWVFSLSLFDVFVIEAPVKGEKGAAGAGAKGGYLGSFLTGIFAVTVATPCMAPLLGTALGFAFSQPPMVILAVFSVTGIGFGFPFLLLGFRPGIIARFPKPGAWMNTFKELMGFLLMGTAVYLFNSFSKIAPNAVSGALWWLLLLGFSAWLLGKARHPSSRPGVRVIGQITAIAIVAVMAIGFLGPMLKSGALPQAASPDNQSVQFEESDFLKRIDSGETVFLEFTAQWCTTCKLNQRVIKDARIQKLMASRSITHIKADLTSYDETITRLLADFGRAGVPLYVLYRQGEEPYVFPALITVNQLMRQFDKL